MSLIEWFVDASKNEALARRVIRFTWEPFPLVTSGLISEDKHLI